MVSVKVTTTSGITWSTSINGTKEEIEYYFLGVYFNVGIYPVEKMEKVIKVEILK